MEIFEFRNRSYAVDEYGFLKDPGEWDVNYAEGMAVEMGMPDGLQPTHMDILSFIRKSAAEEGRCPTIQKVCSRYNLKTADFKRLLPAGYQRGACKLAGLTSFSGAIHPSWFPGMRKTGSDASLEQ